MLVHVADSVSFEFSLSFLKIVSKFKAAASINGNRISNPSLSLFFLLPLFLVCDDSDCIGVEDSSTWVNKAADGRN